MPAAGFMLSIVVSFAGKTALALASLILVGCDDDGDETGATVSATAATACADGTWGLAPYDALLDVRTGGEPLLYATEPARWIDTPEALALASRLEAAARVEPSLPPRARVVLQNDVWGLWQRVHDLATSSPARDRLLRASAALARRLALDHPPGANGTPAVIARLLPASEGWRDVEAELPVFSHERLFGLRRLFHLRVRENEERALYSTLVALDAEGRPRPTDVVGDLEHLRFDGPELAGGRVHELDRRALRCDGPLASLREVDRVTRVPGLGADGFLATFEPPATLDVARADIPCARCHEDAFAMSLPSDALEPGRRHRALLDQVERAERPR